MYNHIPVGYNILELSQVKIYYPNSLTGSRNHVE